MFLFRHHTTNANQRVCLIYFIGPRALRGFPKDPALQGTHQAFSSNHVPASSKLRWNRRRVLAQTNRTENATLHATKQRVVRHKHINTPGCNDMDTLAGEVNPAELAGISTRRTRTGHLLTNPTTRISTRPCSSPSSTLHFALPTLPRQLCSLHSIGGENQKKKLRRNRTIEKQVDRPPTPSHRFDLDPVAAPSSVLLPPDLRSHSRIPLTSVYLPCSHRTNFSPLF